MGSLKVKKKRIIATSPLTTNGSHVGSKSKGKSTLKSTMRVATKVPHISIHFRSNVPSAIVQKIASDFSEWIDSIDDDETFMEWGSTEMHKKISSQMTPGNTLAAMRDAHGITQSELSQKLNNEVSPKRISDWENGYRAISKEWAKKLSSEFKIPVEMFL